MCSAPVTVKQNMQVREMFCTFSRLLLYKHVILLGKLHFYGVQGTDTWVQILPNIQKTNG